MAAVEKIEGQRKPDDFFGHRNREHKGVAEMEICHRGDTIIIHPSPFIIHLYGVPGGLCGLTLWAERWVSVLYEED